MPAKKPYQLTPLHACVALSAITLIAFSPVFWLDFNIVDDAFYVFSNPGVNQGISLQGIGYALTSVVEGNYHPVTVFSHQLDVSLFGLNPGGHHAVSLLFHIANVCLLFTLMARLTGSPWRSLAVAAIFAIHPLRVESVAWVSERKDVLSAFFMLLAMGAYQKFTQKRGAAIYLRMLVWYVLALLSKPMPVTLPFVLLLLDFWPLGRAGADGIRGSFRALPRLAYEKLPMFAVTAAFCVIAVLAQRESGFIFSTELVPLPQRLLNGAVSYLSYLRMFFLPFGLAAHYPLRPHSAALAAVCVTFIAAVTAWAIYSARKRPYLVTGWFWYLGMLVPVIGIVQVGSQALADRYTYTPLIGIGIVIVWLVGDAVAVRRESREIAAIACSVVFVVLAAMTIRQTLYWKDGITLFRRAVEVVPDDGFSHLMLGKAYMREFDATSAVPHYQRAMELTPNDRNVAFGLGTALSLAGRDEEAIPYLRAATTSYSKPEDAFTNLGHALLRKNLLEDARIQFSQALKIDPNQDGAIVGLGIAEGMLGNGARSIELLTTAVKRQPANAEARFNLGIAFLSSGKNAEAVAQFEEVLRLRPNHQGAAALLEKARQGKP